ncbi:MAG TPA: hypothetical protein VMZ25_10040, partial [Terriglobales bacterium]|nr:hypothetical protein [Terriglobales bacterium]
LVAAANAQVRDRVISSAPQGAVNRGYSGVQAQSQHHDDGDSVQVGVQVGTGIRDTIRFDRPRDHRNRGNIFYGNRCYRCSLSGAYHNPYYAMPVYVERYDGPDFSENRSAYSVYSNHIPEEYVAPGAAAVDAAYHQGQMDQRINSLADEVSRLRAEKDAKAQAQTPTNDKAIGTSFANSGTLDANAPASGPTNAATATLVFRNGQRLDIANYAIVGKTLWVFDEQRARRIALADLNLEATTKLNADNGFEFKLPAQK